MKTEIVNYQAKNVDLKGYVAFPDEENAPLVLIAHTWAGKDEFVHQRAEDLAALGYVGFAVDMYGNGKVGADTAENESLMTPLVSDRDMLKDRIVSALNFGKSLPGVDSSRVAAIGYCFGGLVVLDLARSGVQKEMTEANADWQLHSYGGTYHAFTNPDANDPSLGTQFSKSANDRSWQSMKNFFAEIF